MLEDNCSSIRSRSCTYLDTTKDSTDEYVPSKDFSTNDNTNKVFYSLTGGATNDSNSLLISSLTKSTNTKSSEDAWSKISFDNCSGSTHYNQYSILPSIAPEREYDMSHLKEPEDTNILEVPNFIHVIVNALQKRHEQEIMSKYKTSFIEREPAINNQSRELLTELVDMNFDPILSKACLRKKPSDVLYGTLILILQEISPLVSISQETFDYSHRTVIGRRHRPSPDEIQKQLLDDMDHYIFPVTKDTADVEDEQAIFSLVGQSKTIKRTVGTASPISSTATNCSRKYNMAHPTSTKPRSKPHQVKPSFKSGAVLAAKHFNCGHYDWEDEITRRNKFITLIKNDIESISCALRVNTVKFLIRNFIWMIRRFSYFQLARLRELRHESNRVASLRLLPQLSVFATQQLATQMAPLILDISDCKGLGNNYRSCIKLMQNILNIREDRLWFRNQKLSDVLRTFGEVVCHKGCPCLYGKTKSLWSSHSVSSPFAYENLCKS